MTNDGTLYLNGSNNSPQFYLQGGTITGGTVTTTSGAVLTLLEGNGVTGNSATVNAITLAGQMDVLQSTLTVKGGLTLSNATITMEGVTQHLSFLGSQTLSKADFG